MTKNSLIAATVFAAAAWALGQGPWACELSAQQPPATEIYLAPISISKEAITVGAAKNATNNPAYDNQPGFLPDSSAFLFSSVRDGKPHDIYRYEIASGAIKQVTSVLEGEYSPTVTPDSKTFSAIRIEEDKTTQRLWRFNLDGSNPQLVDKTLKVGYHVWVDATHVAVFVLSDGQGQPNTLQYVDTTTGKAEIIDKSIGRSLHMRPGTKSVSYIAKPAGGAWLVNEFDPNTKKISTITPTLDRVEDCVWLPDGRLLMATGSMLKVWTPGALRQAQGAVSLPNGGAWTDVKDLGPGLDRITRMAVSPDGKWLAFVAEPSTRLAARSGQAQ